MPVVPAVSKGPLLLIGAGWLGEPLAKRLQLEGYKVVVTARRAERIAELQAAALSSWRLDMEDPGEILGLQERLAPFQTIIWAVPPGKTGLVSYAAQLERLLRHWPAQAGRKFVFVSSTGVYPDEAGIWDENSPVQPNHRLAEAEKVAQNWGAALLILRCGGLCDERRIIGRYFSDSVVADATQPVNYIHREDVIGASLHLLQAGKVGIYNLVAPQHPERGKVFEAQAKRYDFAPPLALQKGGIQRLISSEKLRKSDYEFIYPDPLNF